MRKEIIFGVGALVAVYELSNFAFPMGVRQVMFARDQGECVDCGKRFHDGWLLDCSHFDHDHSKDSYADPANGRVQCLEDHLAYHIKIGDKNGTYLLRRRIEETHGGHTRAWIDANIGRR